MITEDNRMICECCGKEFTRKLSYEDHYEFVLSKDKFGKKINYDVTAICFRKYNNSLRGVDSITERLNCYLHFDNISDDIKKIVNEKCIYVINKIEQAEEAAKDIVQKCTELERAYIYSEIQRIAPFNTSPRGYEDGKILEFWNDDLRFRNGFEFMLDED